MGAANRPEVNPIREWIARELTSSRRPVSPQAISRMHGHPISLISYHCQVLVSEGRAKVVPHEGPEVDGPTFYTVAGSA